MVAADNLLFALKLFSALGCGLVAGVFFAFSTFVMRALARLPPAEGAAAMQTINITVINPLFMAAFLGTAAACVILGVSALLRWQQAGAAYVLAGGLLYVVGTFLVTMLFNVPLNNALARIEPGSVDGERVWADYLSAWTTWNHVRTAAALTAAGSLTLALRH